MRGRLAFYGFFSAALALLALADAQAVSESDGLLAFMNAMSGLPAQWMADFVNSACAAPVWPGLTCASASGPITGLELSLFSISGSIPNEINLLSNLATLQVVGTSLEGSIPMTICSLASLEKLTVQDNVLMNGPIPSCIGFSFPAMTHLVLSGSQFSGTIPSMLNGLTNLVTLSLESNILEGTVPSQLGSLTALNYLSLATNKLNGTIPKQLGQLTELRSLYLGFNTFTDSVPLSFEGLINLGVFDVQSNSLLTGCFIEPPALMPSECYITNSNICSCKRKQCSPGCTDCVPCIGSPPPQNAPQASAQAAPQSSTASPSPQMPPQSAPQAAPQQFSPESFSPQSAPEMGASAPELAPSPAPVASAAGEAPAAPPQQSITCGANSNTNCIGPVILGNSSGPSQITISNQTVVQGDFIAQSPNVAVTVFVSMSSGSSNTGAAPLVITGCVTFNGKLNVSIDESRALAGTQAIIELATFAGGYCDGGSEPTGRFSELNVDLGCRTAARQELQYQSSSLSLILGEVDSSQCQQPSSSASSADTLPSSTVVVAVVVPILVVVAVLLILLVIFRRRIIPAYRYEDTSKVELAALGGAKSP